MKPYFSLLALGFIPLVAGARLHRTWSDAELRDAADVIVIATPTTVKETAERAPLPDIAHVSQDGKQSDVIGAGVETTFEVLFVLKGDATLKTLVLHHYREADPDKISKNGPGFVAFDPKQQRRFRMFLKREPDGRYGAVSGQVDPDVAIQAMGSDPINRLVQKLNANNGLWSNGVFPSIPLPVDAPPKEVIAQAVKMTGFDQGRIKTYQVAEMRQVQLNTGRPGTYSAALLLTDLGMKILLFQPFPPEKSKGWWTRFYDVPTETPSPM